MRRPARAKPLILCTVTRMAVGGVQRGLIATLRHADRDAFDFAVLCTKKEGDWAGAVRELGVPLHFQKTLPIWHPFQIARLARRIRRIGPDLIHIHMSQMVIPLASAALLAGGIPYLVHHHSLYDRYWAGQNPLLRRWEHWLTRRAGAVVAVSQAVARCTARHIALDRARLVTIPNGIEPTDFSDAAAVDPRPEWGLAPGTPLVIQVSRYLPTKRIEDFIEAAALVLARWDGSQPRPAFVVVGGGGHPSLRQTYERLIERRRLHGWLILAGTRHDVPSIMAQACVGVLSSENEGFGQVIMEYVAAGLPVATIELPAVGEMVRDGREALLSPARRPDALADNVERLLRDRALAARLVEGGRRRLPLFDWRRATRDYETIYRRLLAGQFHFADTGNHQPLAYEAR